MADSKEWKKWACRQQVQQQLSDLIRKSPTGFKGNAPDLESQAFHRAKTREEYVQLIARVVWHIQGEMDNKQAAFYFQHRKRQEERQKERQAFNLLRKEQDRQKRLLQKLENIVNEIANMKEKLKAKGVLPED